MVEDDMREEQVDIEVRDDDSDDVHVTEQEPDAMHQDKSSSIGLVQSHQPADEVQEDSQSEEADHLAANTVADLVTDNGKMLTYWNKAAVVRDGFEIRAPNVKEPWEFVVYVEPEVGKVLQAYDNDGDVSYLVKFMDDRVDEVSDKGLLRFGFLKCILIRSFRQIFLSQQDSGGMRLLPPSWVPKMGTLAPN